VAVGTVEPVASLLLERVPVNDVQILAAEARWDVVNGIGKTTSGTASQLGFKQTGRLDRAPADCPA
jgi:hypothetical protein